jgi:hypothetical protein
VPSFIMRATVDGGCIDVFKTFYSVRNCIVGTSRLCPLL